MPSLDPFNDIDPLLEALSFSNLDQRTIQEEELGSHVFFKTTLKSPEMSIITKR